MSTTPDDSGASGDQDAADLAAAELVPVRLGTTLAAVALAAAVVVLVLSPSQDAGVWPVVGVASAGPLFLIASGQLWGWQRARHDATVLSGGIARLSFWLHVLSYPLALLGMFAMLTVLVAANFADGRSVIMLFGVIALVLGQGLAAARFLRRGGAPGTIAGHLRRLRDLERRRVAPPSSPE